MSKELTITLNKKFAMGVLFTLILIGKSSFVYGEQEQLKTGESYMAKLLNEASGIHDPSAIAKLKSGAEAGNSLYSLYYYQYLSLRAINSRNPAYLETLKKDATNGNAYAQYALYTHYPLNRRKQIYWLERSAKSGCAEAESKLGYDYLHGGFGIPKDKLKAIQLLTKAANQGDASAELELSACYYYGNGVNKNLRKAFLLLKKSADHNDGAYNVDTYLQLSKCYKDGLGVKKNLGKYEYWQHKAGRIEYLEAIKWISADNPGKAVPLLKKSASHGDAKAAQLLLKPSDIYKNLYGTYSVSLLANYSPGSTVGKMEHKSEPPSPIGVAGSDEVDVLYLGRSRSGMLKFETESYEPPFSRAIFDTAAQPGYYGIPMVNGRFQFSGFGLKITKVGRFNITAKVVQGPILRTGNTFTAPPPNYP